jgi:hypothetical protein
MKERYIKFFEMQKLSHIIVNGEKIKVLVRQKNYYSINMKIRNSGSDGDFLKAESEFLQENPNLLNDLKKGIIITL